MALARLIERHMLRPFEWGAADCCLSVCNVLRDGGRGDPAGPFRGRYHDEAGARAVMGGTTAEVAERRAAELGWREIDPSEARDWDVGAAPRFLAIRCAGRWVAKSASGLLFTDRVRRAWRPE